jgi:hypothetical protein
LTRGGAKINAGGGWEGAEKWGFGCLKINVKILEKKKKIEKNFWGNWGFEKRRCERKKKKKKKKEENIYIYIYICDFCQFVTF